MRVIHCLIYGLKITLTSEFLEKVQDVRREIFQEMFIMRGDDGMNKGERC